MDSRYAISQAQASREWQEGIFPCFRLNLGLKSAFMEKASIVSIGNELLSGQTIDTNASYLSKKLLSIGIPVVSSYTIADDVDSIVRCLNLAGSDAEMVLVTGGLGPTDDDLTRQAFAKYLGAELQLDNELLQKIQKFFTSRNLQMPNRKWQIANGKSRFARSNKQFARQAYIPAGSKALANTLGTAPGIMAHVKDKLFVAMPGVPAEMKQMFEESVLPDLQRFAAAQAMVVRKLKCFGAGESSIAELLGDLCRRGRNPLINCTAEHGVITLHIIATAKDKARAQKLAEKDEKLLTELLGELVYGTGEQTLAEVVGQKLAQQNKTIAVAESCTGGCLAKLLTDIPGASRYFTQGWVTYSNTAKTTELGVPAYLIEKHGAVSGQVASAMARGAGKKAGTDFAIAVTGIAGPAPLETQTEGPPIAQGNLLLTGPAGATKQKPLGLVYISVDSDNGCETKRLIIPGDRELIRLRAAQTALNMLRLIIDY